MAKCTEHRIHSLLAFLSKGEKIHYIFLVLHIYQRKASASPKAQGPRDSCRRQAWYPFHTKMSLRCHQFALYTSHHPPLWPLVSKRQVFEKAPMGFQSLSAFSLGGGGASVQSKTNCSHFLRSKKNDGNIYIRWRPNRPLVRTYQIPWQTCGEGKNKPCMGCPIEA